MSTPYPCRIFRLKSHSRFFIPPFARRSWLGHPRLAMRLGKFGFSVSLSLRYHRFPYRLYGMIDNRQAHNHSLPFPYQRFQAIFLHRHITETGSLRSVNPTYTLYPINIAVQSHPIAFRRLTAFQPYCVPVSAFAFRLGWLFSALSYGAVPYTAFLIALSGRTLWQCPLSMWVAITYSYLPFSHSSANCFPISCAISGVTSPMSKD